MTALRTAVYSDFVAWPRVFNAVVYEFAKVVAEVTGAEIIAPPAKSPAAHHKILEKLRWQASRTLPLPRPPRAIATQLTGNVDLFFFVAANMDAVSELNALKGWRERSGIKIAFIVETWAAGLASQGPYLEILKEFDHIFLLHKAAIPHVERLTGVRCGFLPTAVDGLEAVPTHGPSPRAIDVYSMGRRAEPVHRTFLDMARTSDFNYVFDSIWVSAAPVHDWADHRFLTYNMIRRSKFFVCHDHVTTGGAKLAEGRGEHVLPARLFEGAACGAIMIGSPPRCPEFPEYFPWPDAVIELPEDVSLLPDFMRDLARQEERLSLVRSLNMRETLRAHDWGHRWMTIMQSVGLEPTPALTQRLDRLARLAGRSDQYTAPVG